MKNEVNKYVSGTMVIKKCNVEKHFKDSVAHKNAVLRLASERNETPEGNQKSMVTCVRNINLELRGQLIMKFQLAHFIAVQGKSFKLYQDFVHFEKNVHHVALGSGFLTDTACREMLTYLSKSIVKSKITVPLNKGLMQYYSIHNDGSSSAKTMDEKELFIMKSAHDGIVKFMSLEEPEEANAEGLKAASENSIKKAKEKRKRGKRSF